MKRKTVLFGTIISLLCLTSCGHEETISELSSDSKQESSETTSSSESIAPSNLITLYSNESKLYLNSLKSDNISLLKTYHHRDFDDVPFIDFEEFHYAIRPFIEKTRAFTQIDNDNFVYSTLDDKGRMQFDTRNDTIKFTNFNAFLDAVGENNGIYGDMTSYGMTRYKGSEKTKYIKQGKDATINLRDYGFDLVSENNRLYVSIGVLNGLIFPTFISGLSYNGRDFFTDAFLRRVDLSVFARSGNYNLSWPLASSECPTALKRVANKLDNEAYRFEGLFGDRPERSDLVTMSLFKNGTGTLNGSGGASVHKAMNWKLEDGIIKMDVAQVPFESSDIEDSLGDLTTVWINTKETNYGKKVRSTKMSEENYRELCLSFDYTYGLKEYRKIESFDKFFKEKNLKDRLLSNDIMVYEDAFSEFINRHIDDIHSSINGGESVYSASEERAFFPEKNNFYKGDRNKAYYQEIVELGQLRSETPYINSYIVEGNTACLKFQIFSHKSSSCFPINNKEYQTENHEQAVAAYQNAVGDNPYKAFAIAFNDLKKMENIKNVVIDVTGNIGGEIRCMPYLTAFMTLDPTIVVGNPLDGSVIDFHYKVDLNGDGVFGGTGDSFEGKYNFYILNGANFSAGNEISTLAKIQGFAKNIGRKSAGGSCAVGNKTDISGLTYRVSSMYTLMAKENDNYIPNDAGVTPDLTIPFDNMFDLKKLDAWLNTLN